MAVASVDDVAISLGRPITEPNELAQVDQWLSDAELQIRLRFPDLSKLDQEVLAFVEREAVVSRLRNPDGYQYESIDDYRYGLPAESRRVTITADWWAMLAPTTRGSFYTVRMSNPLDIIP